MGRIKSLAIKSLGDELIADNKDRFSENFDSNKKVVSELRDIKHKKTRNVLSGYITNKMKIINKRGF